MTAFVDKPRPQELSTSFTISLPSCRKLGKNISYHSSVQQVSRCLEIHPGSHNWNESFAISNPHMGVENLSSCAGISCRLFVNNQRLFRLKTLTGRHELMLFTHIQYQHIYLMCFVMIIFKHLGRCLLKRKGWQGKSKVYLTKVSWCNTGEIFSERKVLAGVGQKQNGQLLPRHYSICIFSLTWSKLPRAKRKARLLVSIQVGPLVLPSLTWAPCSAPRLYMPWKSRESIMVVWMHFHHRFFFPFPLLFRD